MNPVLASTGMTSDWMGTLEQGGNVLRLLVDIRQAADGCGLTASWIVRLFAAWTSPSP